MKILCFLVSLMALLLSAHAATKPNIIFILADDQCRVAAQEMDFLDVAPTVLDYLGHPAPRAMAGTSILNHGA